MHISKEFQVHGIVSLNEIIFTENEFLSLCVANRTEIHVSVDDTVTSPKRFKEQINQNEANVCGLISRLILR